MNATQLKRLYQQNNPDGHFFDHKTMQFFGGNMKNYSVRKVTIRRKNFHNEDKLIKCWKLSRRKAVKDELFKPAYFDDNGNLMYGVK